MYFLSHDYPLSPIMEEREEEMRDQVALTSQDMTSSTSCTEANNSSTITEELPNTECTYSYTSENGSPMGRDERSPRIQTYPSNRDSPVERAQRSPRLHAYLSDRDSPMGRVQRSPRIQTYPSDSDSYMERVQRSPTIHTYPSVSNLPVGRVQRSPGGQTYPLNWNSPVGTVQRSPRIHTYPSDKMGLQISPRIHRHEKGVIESRSGRKHEDVEVVKQKYINSEIQDIPRRPDGPIQYGHLHRSRSSHMGFGSLDIRNQIHKLRYKLGTNLLHGHAQKDVKKAFRCKKLDVVPPSPKSVVELLYGDIMADDTDPELVALFEDYVEEREYNLYHHDNCNGAKKATNTPGDTGNNGPLERSGECLYDNKDAFFRGFFQGIYHSSNKVPTEVTRLDDSLQHVDHVTQPSKDPCMDETSHADIIRTNQDTTHRFLREWEQQFRNSSSDEPSESLESLENTQSSPYCFACKEVESRSRNATLLEQPIHQHPSPPIFTPTPVGEIHRPETRFLAPLEVVPPLQLAHSSEARENDQLFVNDLSKEKRPKHSKAGQKKTKPKRRLNNKTKENLQPLLPKPKSNSSEKGGLIACPDKDVSIITIAKQKLEHKDMSSLALENLQKRVRDKDMGGSLSGTPSFTWGRDKNSDSKIRRTQDTLTPMKEKESYTPVPVKIPVCSLGGWMTETRSFCDENEALHMSVSELLHPVDSQEKLELPIALSVSESSSLSSNKKEKPLSLKRSDHSQGSDTHAKLSDLDGGKRDTMYESSAFKFKPRPLNNYKKASELAKLRLTKTCDISPRKDKAFVNVPLPRCMSYNIEQKLQSQVQPTANINLSEKLANQLKSMGKDKGTTRGETHMAKTAKGTGQDDATHCPSAEELKGIDGQRLDTKEHIDTSQNINLPEIYDDPCFIDGGKEYTRIHKNTTSIERHNEDRVELPPISIIALKSRKPSPEIENYVLMDISKVDDFSDVWRGGGVAVRAESCASPYNFDKSDPNTILLKATSLPQMHSICTQCGFINETASNTSGHEPPEKHARRTRVGVNRSGGVHEHCCGPRNDEKWRLEQALLDQSIGLPKVNVSKLSHNGVTNDANKARRHEELYNNDDTSRCRSREVPLHKTEELSFNFLDQNIKLKFQCEMTVEHDGAQRKQSDPSDIVTTSSRLNQMAVPVNRDKLESSIARETRIYKEKNRRNMDASMSSDVHPTSTGSPSPYLEYLKRKSDLEAMRVSELQQPFTDNRSDTMLDSSRKPINRQRTFPVIPVKKKQHRGSKTQKRNNQVNAASITNDLFIGPNHLPLLKTDRSNTFLDSANRYSKIQGGKHSEDH